MGSHFDSAALSRVFLAFFDPVLTMSFLALAKAEGGEVTQPRPFLGLRGDESSFLRRRRRWRREGAKAHFSGLMMTRKSGRVLVGFFGPQKTVSSLPPPKKKKRERANGSRVELLHYLPFHFCSMFVCYQKCKSLPPKKGLAIFISAILLIFSRKLLQKTRGHKQHEGACERCQRGERKKEEEAKEEGG